MSIPNATTAERSASNQTAATTSSPAATPTSTWTTPIIIGIIFAIAGIVLAVPSAILAVRKLRQRRRNYGESRELLHAHAQELITLNRRTEYGDCAGLAVI